MGKRYESKFFAERSLVVIEHELLTGEIYETIASWYTRRVGKNVELTLTTNDKGGQIIALAINGKDYRRGMSIGTCYADALRWGDTVLTEWLAEEYC